MNGDQADVPVAVEPQQFRAKYLDVEAIQLTGDADWEAIAEWCDGELVNHAIADSGDYESMLMITTPSGKTVAAYEDEWVAKALGGCWPVGPATFAEMYERATTPGRSPLLDVLPADADADVLHVLQRPNMTRIQRKDAILNLVARWNIGSTAQAVSELKAEAS